MRYLQKQRKSIILKTGSSYKVSLFLAFAIALSVLIPGQLQEISYRGNFQLGCQEACISAPSLLSHDVIINRREGSQRVLEALEQRTGNVTRYVQQVRMLLVLAVVFALQMEPPEPLFQWAGHEQRELVFRDRMIVEYIRRADGKKNGIFSSIK